MYLDRGGRQSDCERHERVRGVGGAALEGRAQPARGVRRAARPAALHATQLFGHATLPRLILGRRR